MARAFDPSELKKLYRPDKNSSGEDNGQVTVIGGSPLFHGAPILSVVAASRVVDMVFFTSPEKSVGEIASKMKSMLSSFIWIPWPEVAEYVKKSDAVLIGPGFMRFSSEKMPYEDRGRTEDEVGKVSKEITEALLKKLPSKKWVIDAGSLQTMQADWIPENAILTPNAHEFKTLFGEMDPTEAAKKHKCIIVLKGPTTSIFSSEETIEVTGGNAGMTKGGTGDVQAGLTAAILAKNDPLLAASAASYIIKKSAESLAKRMGTYFNSDDLALEISKVMYEEIH